MISGKSIARYSVLLIAVIMVLFSVAVGNAVALDVSKLVPAGKLYIQAQGYKDSHNKAWAEIQIYKVKESVENDPNNDYWVGLITLTSDCRYSSYDIQNRDPLFGSDSDYAIKLYIALAQLIGGTEKTVDIVKQMPPKELRVSETFRVDIGFDCILVFNINLPNYAWVTPVKDCSSLKWTLYNSCGSRKYIQVQELGFIARTKQGADLKILTAEVDGKYIDMFLNKDRAFKQEDKVFKNPEKQPQAKITKVKIGDKYIYNPKNYHNNLVYTAKYGEWIPIEIKATNDGSGKATWQTITVSFPDLEGYSASKFKQYIKSVSPYSAKVKGDGDTAYGCYSERDDIILEYPLVENVNNNVNPGDELWLSFEFKPPKPGVYRIYVKSIVGGVDYKAIPYKSDPKKGYGAFDQQNEYNYCFKIKVEEPKPKISVSDTYLDFGEVKLGEKKSKYITIFNNGDSTAEIEVTPKSYENFYPNTLSITILPHSSKKLWFTFKPKSVGWNKVTFTLKTNDPNNREIKITLEGTGKDYIKKLKIEPSSWSAKVGETKQFRAKAYYASGKTKYVTYQAQWRSSDSNVVRHIGNGEFKAVGSGSTKIIVEYEGKRAEATVYVEKRTFKIKIKTEGLKNGYSDVKIDGRYVGRVNDYDPLTIDVEQGYHTITVSREVTVNNGKYVCNDNTESLNVEYDRTITFRYEFIENNHPPKVELKYPSNGDTVKINDDRGEVKLIWRGYDQDNDRLIYTVYVGENRHNLHKYTTTSNEECYVNVEVGKTYYWKIEVEDEHGTKAQSDIWSFKVEKSVKEYELTIKTIGLDYKSVKLYIDDKYHGVINDHNPVKAKLREGTHTVRVEKEITDGKTKYICEENEKVVNLNSNKEVRFEYNQCFKVEVSTEPSDAGSVEVNPEKDWYESGSSITLKAIPNKGYTFKYWEICKDNDCSKDESNPITLTVDNTLKIKAVFKQSQEEKAKLKGDLNGNGKLDTGDATLILKMVIGDLKPNVEVADMNGNGIVDTGDATIVKKKVVGR
jgi:hypothetical protein